MIKNYEEFVNETNITNRVKVGNTGSDLLVFALDGDTNAKYNVKIEEQNFDIDEGSENNHLPAAIYVMPDDTVEIRTIGTDGKYIHGVIEGLSGDDVRNDGLHRHEWTIAIRLHREDM